MQASWTAAAKFGEEHFGGATLGDARRVNRLVAVGAQLARHPGGTFPEKMKDPGALKGLYRLMDNEAVTHERVLQPHIARTVERMRSQEGGVLILHDTTELDYSGLKSLQGELGQIGNGGGRGYKCHNSLAVAAESREILGLSNQLLFCRPQVSKGEKKSARRQRSSRESLLWLQGSEALPAAPAGRRWVDVADRGADTTEFLDFEAMKTGCNIEKMEFTSQDRLKPAIALVSVVAILLLTLRDRCRRSDSDPRSAREVIPSEYVTVLSAWRYQAPARDLTVREFYFALARLGGHQNRKRDHPPGWLVVWRGWTQLQIMVEGALAVGGVRCG